jgi:hypothetical protein
MAKTKVETKRAQVRKELIERLKDLAHSATLRAAQVELGMDNDEDYVRKAATIDHLSKLLKVLDTLQ